MKKQLRFFFAATLASAGMLAQPTITATGINPVIGDHLSIVTSTVVPAPGSAGANQTWNLSTMTGTAATNTIVASSSTTYSASFPNANVATSTAGAQVYYKTSATAWQFYGVQQGTLTMAYSNPEDLMRFPFTYTNNYTDSWSTTFTNSGVTFYRTGADSITADGYGTLTTPAGTFGGVLRVHIVQNYQDSTTFGNIIYRNDEYMWYLNNNHYPIATVYTLTTSGNPASSGSYMTNVAVGIEEQAAELASCKLFPNPVSNVVNLSLTLDAPQQVEIKLFNSLGSQVGSPVVAESTAGSNTYHLNTTGFPEGIYFAQVSVDGKLSETRRFIVSR
jgi:hypothetical protein